MVGLIIKLHNRSIPPQLHVIFDDMFTTVESTHNDEVVTKIWTNMITSPNACLHVLLDEDKNPTLADEWLDPEEVQEKEATRRQRI